MKPIRYEMKTVSCKRGLKRHHQVKEHRETRDSSESASEMIYVNRSFATVVDFM